MKAHLREWPRLLRRAAARRSAGDSQPYPDSIWAPPYDHDLDLAGPRVREPWPPLPLPPPPAKDAESVAGDRPPGGPPVDQGAVGGRRRTLLCVGVAALVVWVAVAGFAPRGARAKTTSALSSPAPTAAVDSNPFQPSGAGGGFSRRGSSGTIEKVDGSTLTLITRSGQRILVATTDSTVVTEVVGSTLAAVKPGDTVQVAGVRDGTAGTLVASRIIAGPTVALRSGPPAGQAGLASGTVTATADGKLSVSQPDGSAITVLTSPSTAVFATPTVPLRQLAASQSVVVRGVIADDGTVTAAFIEATNGSLPSLGGGQFNLPVVGSPASPTPPG